MRTLVQYTPSCLMARGAPGAVSLETIRRVVLGWLGRTDVSLYLAGSPKGMDAPGGMAEIVNKSNRGTLGVAGGLTLVKNAAAFVAPTFTVRKSHDRVGNRVCHYATVERTTADDVVHESFYPMPGNHLRTGMTVQINGRTHQHYLKISQPISELIRQGEQEHLDDAQRAFDITYKLIADEINALAGRRFGPASSPSAAEQMAADALESALPHELGINPANWAQVLDRLLKQTETRDTEGWHALSTDPPQTTGNMILDPVSTTGKTAVGKHPSSKVVNY